MAYRQIKWWNFYDILAKYANLFVTSIYIYCAFYLNVNLFSCINMFVLVRYFMNVTTRVGKRAETIQKVSCVQTQCDIKMASLVTKRYKKEAFYEFLQARK